MSTEIVRATAGHSKALSLGAMTAHDAWDFAETLARTPLLPDAYRNNPASVLWALEYGRALGIDVVTTITTIHVIKGKPTQSADLMLSRTRAAGHRVRVKPDRDRCTVSITRSDDPDDETVIEWTLDDAVTAGLCELRNGRPYSRSSKGEPQAWEKYPRAMLRSRAVAEAVRTVCPEVLHGAIYTPEELGAYVDQEGNPIDAPVQPLRVVSAEEVGPRRDYLREAREAADAAAVRQIWQAAGAAGAGPDYLEQIAAVGREKAAAAAASEVVEAEVVGDEPNEQAAAVDELRAAALAAGVAATIEQDFADSYGMPLADAPADTIREMARLIAGAA